MEAPRSWRPLRLVVAATTPVRVAWAAATGTEAAAVDLALARGGREVQMESVALEVWDAAVEETEAVAAVLDDAREEEACTPRGLLP